MRKDFQMLVSLPRSLLRVALFAGLVSLAGCATTYIPPGPRADMQAFAPAPASIQDGFAAKPAAPFPATLAFVRVQGRDYFNFDLMRSAPQPPGSRYSVITTREVEDDALIDRLGRLPQIAGVTGFNQMLLPARLEGDKELRAAAARLQADLLLVYTFDTAFFQTDSSRPLTVISLGIAATKKIAVTTTVSALLIDTRTGYIYSTYETTKRSDTQSSAWSSASAADETRRANEKEAFGQLVGEIEKTWPRFVERYARKG